MSLFALSGLLTGLSSLGIGAWVYFSNRTNRINRLWSFFCVTVAVWGFGGLKIGLASDHETALIWWRITYIAVIFIPSIFYHFVSIFLEIHRPAKIVLAYLLSLGFLIADASPLLIANVSELFRGLYYVSRPIGQAYPFLVLFFIAMVILTHIDLWRYMVRTTAEKRRLQVRWFFLAGIVGYVGGISCFLPVFGVNLYPYGNFTIPLFPVLLSYAIFRYQFLDIEVIIKRTLVFAGLVGSVVAVVSLVAFVSQDVLSRFVEIPKWLSNVFAAMVIAGLYGPLRNRLVNVTERYLFQKKYDYKELLKRFTDEVMVMVDLRQLVQMTVNTLSETVKLDGASLLLLDKDKRTYDLAASRGLNGRQVAFGEQEQFIRFLRETHEPIGLDGPLAKVRFPGSVHLCLKQLNARLCLPLNLHDDLIGVLCLGKKKSDEEFTKDDLDILLPLARTLAIAVSNAELFEELAKTQAEAAQKEKLAVIGTLSAGINHEICNPLGIVKAQCEAFLLDVEDGILVGKTSGDLLDRTTAIMRGALKQIDRATAITQKLSNFAKPIKEPTAQPVSVAQEVDEVLMLVGHDLTLEKIAVEKAIAPDLPPIVVDRRQLQEVLFNLIRNAAQAIAPPGTIWVRAHTGGEGQVRIEIADTGSGIPPDKLGKIYDPFFTTKEPGKGTGLGLFIVRQIVERNKGRISVESVVGKGTTFFLDFAAARETSVPARG
ncbi:MAG: GAF domain-containing protein [Candidatus Omnitrophica bacterium]|nr:GAF domain-containing protein [Candidatus Omnitrophota bacterium]